MSTETWTYTDGDYPLATPHDAAAMHTVADKVIIVTGSGRGIGRGMALHLAKGGAKVVVAEWKTSCMDDVLAELERSVHERSVWSATSWIATQIDAMVATTVERFGRVDGLINNAQTFRPMRELGDRRRRRPRCLLHVRCEGHDVGDAGRVPAHGRAALGAHRELRVVDGDHRRTRVRARTTRRRRQSAHSTRTAAREWAMDGIVVNCIAPAAATHKGDAAQAERGLPEFIENCPMRRQGDPEWDIGPLAWFLCSDACRYVTGHTFMADGGAFMWA